MENSQDLIAKARDDLLAIFKAGVDSVAPDAVIKNSCDRKGSQLRLGDIRLDLANFENVYILGAGKATASMAATLEDLLGGYLTEGTITTKYGHTCALKKINMIEAAHPVPDENGEKGSAKILELAHKAGKNDLVICLISGGGSALLPLAASGIDLADKQDITSTLLSCGAIIHEINTIRKHLSSIKGGRLAVAAYPATLVSLILSDVVGDDLDVIASGPTVPDNSTFEDCARIIEKYEIEEQLPESISRHLNLGLQGKIAETPKAGDNAFEKASNFVIGNNLNALISAEMEARKRGYSTLILSSLIEGETCIVAKMHAAISKEIIKSNHPLKPPACIISGGETTVTIKGNGLGGRNQEFALCLAEDIAGPNPVAILSAGTDGNDGPTDAAGAMVDNTTLYRAVEQKMNIDEYLSNNDSYHFFKKLDDLIMTGPTNTNVMDIRIIVVP